MLGIAKPQTKNLIEVLSAGYRVLTECLWVLGIPVVLDLLFWLTPQVVVTPILEPLRADLDAAANALSNTPEQQQELVHSILATDIRLLLPFNYVPLYIVPLADAATAPKLSLTSPLIALTTIVLLNGVLLVLSALFLTVLGREIYPHALPPTWARHRRTPRQPRYGRLRADAATLGVDRCGALRNWCGCDGPEPARTSANPCGGSGHHLVLGDYLHRLHNRGDHHS